jgi:hypothetical protein
VRDEIATVKTPNPSTDDPGQTTYGYYTLVDGLMTMTDGEGKPMRHAVSGEMVTHRMRGADREIPVATVLTRQVYDVLRGKEDRPSGFNRTLKYPTCGLV